MESLAGDRHHSRSHHSGRMGCIREVGPQYIVAMHLVGSNITLGHVEFRNIGRFAQMTFEHVRVLPQC
jgi:hypothetical protein